MRALATSALLALLEGHPPLRQQLRARRGEEIATTELNLLELAWIAARSPPRVRHQRLAALSRLRRHLTVLPYDARAGEEALRAFGRGWRPPQPITMGILSTLEAGGCEHLLTEHPTDVGGRWRFRATWIDRTTPKERATRSQRYSESRIVRNQADRPQPARKPHPSGRKIGRVNPVGAAKH